MIKRGRIIVNFKTGSSAELTTLTLKKDTRTILVGEKSRGALEYSYGNRSFSTKTKCSEFKVVLSTKHNNRKFSKYEYVGIEPDFNLNNKSNWINQVVQMEVPEK